MLPSLSRSGFLCLRASSSRVTLGSALSPRLLRPQARPHQLRFPLRTSSTSTKPDIALNDTPVTSAIAHELADPKRPAAPETLFDRVLPKWAMGAKPYLLLTRIDKPNGAILLFWPGAWAITMAASVNHLPPTVPAFYLGLFAVGALVMRGAGCTVNDMWDAKFDRQVERTKWRPIAAGDVSQLGALTFLGAQLSVGLAILTQLNWYSIVLGASSVGFVIMYPFMKRITYYPQIFFALTFHWGCMLGWSAVAGSVNWPVVLPMYIGSIAWGVMYDCIYAHQDKLDDIKAGVKSIALRFPDSRPLISGLSAFFVSGLTLTGHLAGLGPLYYVISCLGSALHLGWQCKTVDFDNRQDCWRKFCSNGLLGGLIWLGIAADYIYEVVIPGDYE